MSNSAEAEAIRQAVKYFEKIGWRYKPQDIGETAMFILKGMGK